MTLARASPHAAMRRALVTAASGISILKRPRESCWVARQKERGTYHARSGCPKDTRLSELHELQTPMGYVRRARGGHKDEFPFRCRTGTKKCCTQSLSPGEG